jgi:hypothetical protein
MPLGRTAEKTVPKAVGFTPSSRQRIDGICKPSSRASRLSRWAACGEAIRFKRQHNKPEFNMRHAYLVSLPVLVLFILGVGGEPAVEEKAAEEPVSTGLEIHEWGVARYHRDAEMVNADMRAIWDELPPFVYGQINGRKLPLHYQNLMPKDRPIIFFHTPKAVTVDLRIDFPGGLPGVWWPGTQQPAVRDGKLVGDGTADKPHRSLQWRLDLKESRGIPTGKVPLPSVKKDHWIETLRAVKADDVYAHVGEESLGQEHEKFVYYDGLLPRGKWADVVVEKERVVLSNLADFPLFDLTVIDSRTPEKPRVARLDKLDAKTDRKTLEFTDADAKTFADTAVKTLTGQLNDAGLQEDEGRALAVLWKADLFQSEGVTAFYRLPQEEYERLLPLKMTPRPEKIVRVGLVVHPHCEPDLEQKVKALVADLDSDDFPTRQGAQKRLAALGQTALVYMVRLRKQAQSPEVKKRLDELIDKYDAKGAFQH